MERKSHLPSYIFHQNMFDKDRFHNQLALNLGCERILKDTRYSIKVEYNEQGTPVVSIMGLNNERIVFNASENFEMDKGTDLSPDIKQIYDAVHHAYIHASSTPF